MPVSIDISGGIDGTWTIEDDGIPGNGISVVRDPNGVVFTTFTHPADILTLLSRAGQSINVNFVDSLGAANFVIGSLTNATVRPDNVSINNVQTTGTVTIGANNAVSELGSDAGVDIGAGTLLIRAGSGIGSGNAIETDTDILEAQTNTGGITLANSGAVQIGGATNDLAGLRTVTSGDISLTSTGTITLADTNGAASVDSAGGILLNASGATSDINSTSPFDSLIARSGNIGLTAGRDVLFGTGGANFDNDVRAAGSITINAGRDFTIDSFSDMASNDFGTGSNGGVSITAGRDINVVDTNGVDASIGVSTGTGNLVLTTGAGGTLNVTANSAAALFANGGSITINADRMILDAGSGITTTTAGARVTLTSATAGREVRIGSNTDAAAALEISDAELDRINTATLALGTAGTTNVTVVGAISVTPALLIEGENVAVQSDVVGGNVTLQGGTSVTQTAASTITATSVNVRVDTPNGDSGVGGSSDFQGASSVTIFFTGNSDGDVLGGSAGNDQFRVQQGGNDSVNGGAGNDGIYFGNTLTSLDSVDGGDGNDVLLLQGAYSFVALGLTNNFVNLEAISLLPGNLTTYGDTAGNFYSYSLGVTDSVVAAGGTLKVNGNFLRAGENFSFQGTAETDGSFVLFAGQGTDDLTGGQRGDTFIFGHDGRFGAGDRIDGQGGYDIFYLRGDYVIDFNAFGFDGALTNIESIGLISGTDTQFVTGGDGEFDYDITWNDSMLGAGLTLAVNGSRLAANETMAFDGSQETNGHFRIFAGAADDVLSGGGGNDLIYGGLGADTLTGDSGADTFHYRSAAESTSAGRDGIQDFALGDLIDLLRIDANANTAGDDAFNFIGNAAFSGAAGQLRFENVAGPIFLIQGDTNGDGVSDLEIIVVVTDAHPLTGGDFIL